MKRLALLFIPASLVSVVLVSLGAQQQQLPPPVTENTIRCEPILNFDCTGSTMLGFYHQQLTVYNNGRVTLSEMPIGSEPYRIDVVDVDPAAVHQLRRDLHAAGAYTMKDQTVTATDCPMTTVTVFRGETNARSHTFNYHVAYEPYRSVADIVQRFIDDNLVAL